MFSHKKSVLKNIGADFCVKMCGKLGNAAVTAHESRPSMALYESNYEKEILRLSEISVDKDSWDSSRYTKLGISTRQDDEYGSDSYDPYY